MNRAKLPASGHAGLWITVALLHLNCVTEPAIVLPSTAVLVPMNFEEALNDQLAPGIAPATAVLTKYLEHSGLRVVRPTPAEFRAAWVGVLGERKASFTDTAEYASLMAAMLDRFAPNNQDAVIAVPSIVKRIALMSGRRGSWDGVTRIGIVEVSGEQAKGFKGHFDATGADAVSIHVLVYDRRELLHDGYGGIGFTWKYASLAEPRGGDYHLGFEPLVSEEIFGDARVLAHSVRVAFDPYIPRK